MEDDVTLPDLDDELRSVFLRGTPSGSPRSEQSTMLVSAEAYAKQYRDNPRAQQQWAEAAPAVVRAYFQAIRANTPGAKPRDPATPEPYRRNPDVPQLSDLSPELQRLLALSWPVWDSAGRA